MSYKERLEKLEKFSEADETKPFPASESGFYDTIDKLFDKFIKDVKMYSSRMDIDNERQIKNEFQKVIRKIEEAKKELESFGKNNKFIPYKY